MTTIQRTETRCDFCGYGGPFSEPQDFTRRGLPGEQIDLCRWCTRPAYPPGSKTTCGQHEATMTEDGWTCTCGETFRDTGTVTVHGWPFFVPTRIRNAVPDLATATAVHHVQS